MEAIESYKLFLTSKGSLIPISSNELTFTLRFMSSFILASINSFSLASSFITDFLIIVSYLYKIPSSSYSFSSFSAPNSFFFRYFCIFFKRERRKAFLSSKTSWILSISAFLSIFRYSIHANACLSLHLSKYKWRNLSLKTVFIDGICSNKIFAPGLFDISKSYSYSKTSFAKYSDSEINLKEL